MNVMRLRYRALVFFTLFASVTVSGCNDENPTSPSALSSWVRLERNVVIISDDSPITLEQIEDSTYVFSFAGGPTPIEVGNILICSQGKGYVRLVTGIESTSQRIFIQTTNAWLTDAVIYGGTETLSSIGFGSGELAGPKSAIELAPCAVLTSGGVDLSGLTLYEGEVGGEAASIRIEEGYVEYNPDIAIDLGFAGHAVQMFRCVTEGTLSYRFDVSVHIPAEFVMDGEMHIATVRRTVVHSMGIVPITAALELELLLAWEFSGSYAGECATSFAGEYEIATGADYSAGAWSDIGAVEPSLSAGALRCIDYAETSGFRLVVVPRLSVELFGETASFTQNSAETGFTAHTESPPVWDWSIHGEYSDSCLLRPECLGTGPEIYSPAPTHYSTTIRTGPYRTDFYILELLWGNEGSGPGEFSYPRGAAIDAEGNLFVTDSRNSRIQKFAPDSTFITKWGREGFGDGQFLMPADIAIDDAGNIYVTDSGNNRIQKFTPDTTFVTAWGSRGSGQGEFESPTGIAAGPDGSIYVVDTGNHRVQKFTPDGIYITEWGVYGSGPGQFDTPRGIAADPYGNVYVTGCRNNRVQKFSNDGIFLDSWGTYGTAEGELYCPIAVAMDEAGNIYVVDYGNDRLQKFTSTGAFVTFLGSSGIGEGEFDRPEGVAVGHTGVIFIIDSRNSRIQKFALIQ